MRKLRRPGKIAALGLAAGCFVLSRLHACAAEASAPLFELPDWKTGEAVKLADFAGQIVVLDFFAYWCAPCRPASAEIDRAIGKYYAAMKGNRYGVPVHVLAVNVERDQPERTAEFITETGVDRVVNDFDGVLLSQFGGAATPHIVVIDGTRTNSDLPGFHITYNEAGFPGARKLRQVIDAIRPVNATAVLSTAQPPREWAMATGAPVSHKPEVAFEALLASDIQVTSSSLTYGQAQSGTEWKLNLTYRTIDANYEPYRLFDFIGFEEDLHDDYLGGQASAKRRVSRSLSLLAAGGAYDGFTDFRSLWRANYYKQQFSFVPGYTEPDPHGFNASGGVRWEYQPTTGIAEAGFLYANDAIAPGWEGPVNLRSSREYLHTYAPSLKFENVITSRIRTQNELQLTFTSAREPRYTYHGLVNVALGERWVWRTTGGYAHENPTLRAWNVGSTLEFELVPKWHLNVSGLYYHDTGEIENSVAISSAAPGLEAWQGGLGLRYLGRHHSFSVSVAPVYANYDRIEVGTRPFTNLYEDRLWVSLQAAWSLDF